MCELFICTKSDRAPEGINWMSSWKGHFVSMCRFHSGNTDGSGPVINESEKKTRPTNGSHWPSAKVKRISDLDEITTTKVFNRENRYLPLFWGL